MRDIYKQQLKASLDALNYQAKVEYPYIGAVGALEAVAHVQNIVAEFKDYVGGITPFEDGLALALDDAAAWLDTDMNEVADTVAKGTDDEGSEDGECE